MRRHGAIASAGVLLVGLVCVPVHVRGQSPAQGDGPIPPPAFRVGDLVRVVADHADGDRTVVYLITDNDAPAGQWQPVDVLRDFQVIAPLRLTAPGRREIRITAEAPGGARSTSQAAVVDVSGPCLFANEGADPSTATPRPIGTFISSDKAYDPASASDRAKSGARTWQLWQWGWRVWEQADRTAKRLTVKAWCVGTPQ